MLNQQTIEIIKSTVPLLEQHGRTITDVFYENLFENAPFLKNIFNMSNQGKGEQSQALSDAVLAYAKNIDNIEALIPAVQRIAHKHASLGIQAKQYDVVGTNLLIAIKTVLGLPDDHPALEAWAQAYGVLAKVFIDTEQDIYEKNKNKQGGWEGYRDFYIDSIVEESSDVKSIVFKPVDLGAVPEFKGGQYIGVKVRPDNSNTYQIRQYSLSQKGDLRISIKAEHDGLVSNYLHNCVSGDSVLLQAPTGVFTLADEMPKHIFIAGGIGITPLMSMLYEAINEKGISGKDILFIQCAKNGQQHVFQQELQSIIEASGINYKLSYETSEKCDHQGYLNQDIIAQWLAEYDFSSENSQVYFCGPKPFMAVLNQFFKALKYDESNIHYEVFGPTTSL